MIGHRLLVDTAFVQALFNRSDQYHERARRWSHYLRRPDVAAEWWTTEAILIEIANAFSSSNRPAAAEFIRNAYHAPTIRVARRYRVNFKSTGLVREPSGQDVGPDRLHFLLGDEGPRHPGCPHARPSLRAGGVRGDE